MSAASRARTVLAACIGLVAATVNLPAQQSDLIAYGGVVAPLGKLIQQGRASIGHVSKVAFGGRLDVWLTPSAGLEVAADYSPSGYRHVDTTGAALDTTGALLHATGRMLYRFAQGGVWSAHILAGAGIVSHSGVYLTGTTGKTSLCGVVGVAGQLRIVTGWTVQLTAEDYVYSARLGGFADVPGASGTLNNDLVLSFGVAVPLGARGDDDLRVIR